MCNDEDWLVYPAEGTEAIYERILPTLAGLGWESESSPDKYGNMPKFISLRKGDINLIVVEDPDFALRWIAATVECASKNLATREERVAVFKRVLYSSEG